MTAITTESGSNPFQRPGIHIEAVRGHQGDRQMFLLLVTNNVLLRNFAAEAEVSDGAERVQRGLDRRHYHDIVTYLTENSGDYVLGAMTYATDMVDDECFVPVAPGSNIGTLILPMNAKLRCLDGQHRRAAIADAVAADDEFGDDFSAVVLYVEDDYAKRRQMFSDMNATPKVVSKALNITFDTRDPYARAAQRLAAEHPMLQGMVEMQKARINSSDPKLFSLAGVYDGLKRYDLGMVLPRGRSPKGKTEDELVAIGTELFDVISSARPEYQEIRDLVASSDPGRELNAEIQRLRKKTLLLSTTTLRVVAGALNDAMKHDEVTDVTLYKERLADVDFTPTSATFNNENVAFVGQSGTPSARNQEVFGATKELSKAIRLR